MKINEQKLQAERIAALEKLTVRIEAMAGRLETCESALRLIAKPIRSDGTYNLGRAACQKLAEEALK